jgi:hypothetical protein
MLLAAFATAHRSATAGDAKFDAEAQLHSISSLEENARFPEAVRQCTELLKAVKDQPELLVRVQTVEARLNEESRAAADIGFALSSLTDAQCAAIAEERFKESGDAGRILLRKAFRDGPEALTLKACAILLDLKDRPLATLCAERLAANPQEPLRKMWLKVLWASIARLDPAALAALGTHADDREIARLLVAAVRRSGDDSPAAFATRTKNPNAFEQFKKLGLLSEVPVDALTVHFKFDEKQGAAAINAAGGENAVRASIRGAKFVDGKVGGGLSFNSTDDVVILDDKSLECGKFDADFSVCFWMYLNAGAAGAWRNMTHKGHSDDERTFAMWLHPDSNHVHFRISTYASNNEGGDSNAEVPVGKWTHLTYVKTGRKLQLFFDDHKDNELELAAAVQSNAGPLYIGKDPWFSGINGMISDYRIYSRALLPSEISILSTAPQK